MIKYKLICKKCTLSFDSWFASSQEYDKLKNRKFLSCHNCNSKNVEKSLMSPNFINKNKLNQIDEDLKLKKIDKKIKEYQKFIKDNFDYVGENFSYEARSIHYNNKKRKKKGIYGSASIKEIKDLKEEGIETESIPWIEDKNN
tara:strand:- start:646 stop:1074 length:429 start_codon:yes stop_codon:yes gene_type:complete